MVGDWTAFVPAMRPFLQFKSLDDVSLKRESISISDIELVTDRIVKVLPQVTQPILDGRNATSESYSK